MRKERERERCFGVVELEIGMSGLRWWRRWAGCEDVLDEVGLTSLGGKVVAVFGDM